MMLRDNFTYIFIYLIFKNLFHMLTSWVHPFKSKNNYQVIYILSYVNQLIKPRFKLLCTGNFQRATEALFRCDWPQNSVYIKGIRKHFLHACMNMHMLMQTHTFTCVHTKTNLSAYIYMTNISIIILTHQLREDGHR